MSSKFSFQLKDEMQIKIILSVWSGLNTLITGESVVRSSKMCTQLIVYKIDTREEDINNYNKLDFKHLVTSYCRCVYGVPPDRDFFPQNALQFLLILHGEFFEFHHFWPLFFICLVGSSSLFSSFSLSWVKPYTIFLFLFSFIMKMASFPFHSSGYFHLPHNQ